MTLDISQRITNNWPATEAKLSKEDDIDYVSAKAGAVANAKRELYGISTPPSESDMQDVVAAWIGDRATVLLIPVAREWYALNYPRSQSNRQGEDHQRYNIMEVLDGLKEELQRACDANWDAVQSIVGKNVSRVDIPTVSHTGPIVNATDRAMDRGYF